MAKPKIIRIIIYSKLLIWDSPYSVFPGYSHCMQEHFPFHARGIQEKMRMLTNANIDLVSKLPLQFSLFGCVDYRVTWCGFPIELRGFPDTDLS